METQERQQVLTLLFVLDQHYSQIVNLILSQSHTHVITKLVSQQSLDRVPFASLESYPIQSYPIHHHLVHSFLDDFIQPWMWDDSQV